MPITEKVRLEIADTIKRDINTKHIFQAHSKPYIKLLTLVELYVNSSCFIKSETIKLKDITY